MSTNLNDQDDVERDTRNHMKEKGLLWDQQPHWFEAPVGGEPGNKVRLFQGRLLSTGSGRTEFVGPCADELSFWIDARNVVLDTTWDEPT